MLRDIHPSIHPPSVNDPGSNGVGVDGVTQNRQNAERVGSRGPSAWAAVFMRL